MKRILFVLLGLLIFTACKIEDPKSNTDRFAKLDSVLREQVTSQKIPMSAALIGTKDSIIYANYFGFSDSLDKKKIQESTLFGIRSMTKPIASVAILQLVEKGLMKLDDPIGKYLGKYKDLEVIDSFDPTDSTYTTKAPRSQPTIRQLMAHNSGITYALCDTLANAIHVKQGGQGGLADWTLPLMFEPGSKWGYGMGHRICGWALEEVTGQSLEAYCQENIFKPLGMSNTKWILNDEEREIRSLAYQQYDGQTWEPTKWPAAYGERIRGDGGIYSTLEDYAKFAEMLLNNGNYKGNQIVSANSIKELSTVQTNGIPVHKMVSSTKPISLDFPEAVGEDAFGLGVLIKNRKIVEPHTRSNGSYGWEGLMNTDFWIDNENGVYMIFYTQVIPFYHPHAQEAKWEFEKLAYQILN